MSIRFQADPAPNAAADFRDRVRRLGTPERRAIEATRVRIMLARASRVGLRERLAAETAPTASVRRQPFEAC
jgi:hypothetical protein